MDGINLRALRNPDSKFFNSELNEACQFLPYKQASQFFQIVLSHLQTEISYDIGCYILNSICQILKQPKAFEVFIRSDSFSYLPFSQKEYCDQILNILFIIVIQDPSFFDETVISKFSRLIPRSPRKCLVIIAHYAKSFEELANPWPMLDLLFTDLSCFIESPIEYSTTLVFLCRKFKDFRKVRGEKCWNTLVKISERCIQGTRELSSCLSSLCGIAELIHPELPTSLVKSYLKKSDTRSLLFSLIAICGTTDQKIITALLELSTVDNKATIVLMSLAESDQTIAHIILRSGEWMSYPLPTMVYTFRLFLSVFVHFDLRAECADNRHFIRLLGRTIKESNDSKVLQAVVTVLRRIDQTEDLWIGASESGLLRLFFEKATAHESDVALHSALLLADTIGDVIFTSELLGMCEVVVETVQTRPKLKVVAAQVGIHLAFHRRCAKKLIQLGFDKILSSSKNEELKVLAREFKQNIQ